MDTFEENNNKDKSKHIFVLPVLLIRGLLWVPAMLLLYLIRFEVHGRENLERVESGRVVFAANHASEYDPYIFQYALRFPSKFVPLYFVSLTKKYYPFSEFGLRSLCYGGLFFKLMGAYPVYKGLHDFEKAFVYHIKILGKNHPVLIFPEGGRRKLGHSEAKPGIIYLAKRTKASIVPVKISGTENITFRELLLRRRSVSLSFGEPIDSTTLNGDIDGMSPADLQGYASKIMREVDGLL